jgi:flavin reductase (DIM6/NTAB) family NADH-FMN oxidoreductase RutF
MNRCQGTVYGRSLLTETVVRLQEALASYECTRVARIEIMRDGKRTPNDMHVFTFGQILCGYERYSVRQYYPNPLRCGK